jgi:DNA-directed RNA polymerase subunit RPC12/RpoP
MMGRYGTDQLSIALIILYTLLVVAANFTNLAVLAYIGYIPMALCIYRMLTKDINRRRQENYKFVILINPVYLWFKRMLKRAKNANIYRYYKCPNCKQNVYVPKGKGKIRITCPRCKTEFVKKT